MKKNLLIIFSLVILLFGSACTKKQTRSTQQIAAEALEALNKTKLGYIVEADTTKAAVEADTGHKFYITYHEPMVKVDFAAMGDTYPQEMIEAVDFKVGAKSLTVLYKPEGPELAITELQGVWADIILKEDYAKQNPEAKSLQKVQMSAHADRLELGRLDLTPLLTADNQGSWDAMRLLFQANPTLKHSLKGFGLSFQMEDDKVGQYDVEFSLEDVNFNMESLPEFLMGLYNPKASPDFSALLTKADPLLNMNSQMEDMKLSVVRDGKNLLKGNLKEAVSALYIGPEKGGGSIEFSTSINTDGFTLQIEEESDSAALWDFQQMGFKMTIKKISPDLMDAYFNLMKIPQQAKKDKISAEKKKQMQMTQGMRLTGEFMQSKPIMEISLSPVEHRFGTMAAVAKLEFTGAGVPALNCTITLNRLKDIVEKIKKSQALSEKTKQKLASLIEENMVLQNNGDGTLIYETRGKQMYRNGKPVGNN